MKKILKRVVKAVDFIVYKKKMSVNYDRPIKELVKGYDCKNNDITDKNFPSTEEGEREVEFALFDFKKSMNSEGVTVEIEKSGYRPATMKELLLFGNKNPKLQRKFVIIALGSVAELHGYRRVGSLREVNSKRYASLNDHSNYWFSYYRFLAVRK